MSPELILIQYAQQLKEIGFVSVACNKGSISLKENDIIYITPSRLDYDSLEKEDITQLDLSGNVILSKHKVSMDSQFHLAIYKARNDVKSIVHTHSCYATSLAFAGKGFPMITFGVHLQLKEPVKCADFFVPDDPCANDAIVESLGTSNAVLLKNHGVITVGESIKKAFENTVFLEETSKSYVHALQIGTIEELDL